LRRSGQSNDRLAAALGVLAFTLSGHALTGGFAALLLATLPGFSLSVARH